MGRPVRMNEEGAVYFVTARCFQSRALLRPSEETNEVLAGVLGRAIRLYGVELFTFSFLSNHMHLVVRVPKGNLSRFMQYLMTNLSKKVGVLVGWRGAFWERRYSASPILDDEALLERVRYVLSHGPKEGLVRRCRDWPGLSALPLMLDGEPRAASWFNWTRRSSGNSRREIRARLDRRWAEAEELRLARIPHPALAAAGALRGFLRRAVKAIEEQAAHQHRTFLGRSGVLRQSPLARPARTKRKPWPPCHTSRPALRQAFLERYRSFAAAYRKASLRWTKGELSAPFPECAVKPFLWPTARAVLAAA